MDSMRMNLLFGCRRHMLVFVGMLLLSLLSLAHCESHYYDFVLKETNFTRPCAKKSMLTVNGSFPGPTIKLHKGDTVFVNVHNHGDYGLTLHWHGVKQPRNPWSDGPLYITQCLIEPGTNFTYKVIFSTEEGTLWWHAHSDWTQSSVHGAIVILPAKGTTYPYPQPDGDEVIVLGSWYNGNVNQELHEDLAVGSDLPRADAYVINGEAGGFFNCGTVETAYRMYVDYGKTYQLRLINAAVNSELFFAIADHNVTIVGMDGNYLKPVNTAYVIISPGQTMNVLFTANQPLGHYYMAARQLVTAGEADLSNATTAVIEYRGKYIPPSSPVFPSTTLPSLRGIDAANRIWSSLRSLASKDHPVNVPLQISTHMFIDVSQKEIACPNKSCETMDGNRISSALNNITFLNPSVDVLLAYYRNISGIYTTDFPDMPKVFFNFTGYNLYNFTVPTIGTKVKMVDYNETVEIVFQGTNVLLGSVDHPMHLHGYSFYVVGWGLGNFNNLTHPSTYNLVDPPELNTIRVPKKGWITVRFQANNPGVWLWHCHLTKHLTWGMKTAFIVRDGGTPETTMLEPPPSMPKCSKSFVNYIQSFDDDDFVGISSNEL